MIDVLVDSNKPEKLAACGKIALDKKAFWGEKDLNILTQLERSCKKGTRAV